MEIDEDENILIRPIPRKVYLTSLVIFNLLLVIAVVVDYIVYDLHYLWVISVTCFPIVLITIVELINWFIRLFRSPFNFIAGACGSMSHSIGKRTREHRSMHKEVEPMSSYDSIQDRAKGFLKLTVPIEIKSEKDSFANKCIATYAGNGEISLTEEERAELSLTILETGISSQEPGDKSYYERERVAVLENILSEKIKA